MADSLGEVFVLKTTDRATGIPVLLEKFDLGDYSGKTGALKANYNSADPFPASTHIDTLRALVQSLKDAGASDITLAERSGMGDTEQVLEEMGVLALAKELGFKAVVLDDVGKEDWMKVEKDGTHWLKGFYMAKVFHDADKGCANMLSKNAQVRRALYAFTEKLRWFGGEEGSRRNVRLHVGTAWFTIPAPNDCGNKLQLQLGFCFDGWNKSLRDGRTRKGNVG